MKYIHFSKEGFSNLEQLNPKVDIIKDFVNYIKIYKIESYNSIFYCIHNNTFISNNKPVYIYGHGNHFYEYLNKINCLDVPIILYGFDDEEIINIKKMTYNITLDNISSSLINEKLNNVYNFYKMTSDLKELEREGWKKWNVQKAMVETDAEHTFSAIGLARIMYMLYPEYKDIDIDKVTTMLYFHDFAELITGDIPVPDQKEDKAKKERLALEQLLEKYLFKDIVMELYDEFESRETLEAKFAFMCDKVDCDLQCLMYDEKYLINMYEQENNPYLTKPNVIEALDNKENFSYMWIKSDEKRFENSLDLNFKRVLKYAKDKAEKIKK